MNRFTMRVVAAAMVAMCGSAAALAQDMNAGAEAPKVKQPEQKRLSVGDTAPAIKVANWIKGKEISKFEKGKVYVVEFWATWCGPCIRGIPHLTKLQKEMKDKGVEVIGVSIWEEDGSLDKVKSFVEKKGAEMEYNVAYGGDGGGGDMANTWMKAAGRNGIPAAFVVDKEGKIAWIGHPMGGMDEVVKKVVDGTFDASAHAKSEQEKAAKARQGNQIRQQIMKDEQAGDYDKAIAGWDKLVADGMMTEAQVATPKFSLLLLKKKDYKAAYAYASSIEDKVKDDAMTLNSIAWATLDEPGVEQRDLDLAMRFAERAVEVTKSRDGAIMDTLARAHYEKGNLAKAIEIQKKAVELADEDMRGELEAVLKKYEDEAKKKGN